MFVRLLQNDLGLDDHLSSIPLRQKGNLQEITGLP